MQFMPSVNLGEGTYTGYVISVDNLDNYANYSFTLSVNSSAPEINVSYPQSRVFHQSADLGHMGDY